jgi:Hypervirulence associated proteins TUDOR domain
LKAQRGECAADFDGRQSSLDAGHSHGRRSHDRQASHTPPQPRHTLRKLNHENKAIIGDTPMKQDFKVGDRVGWNSEAGHVRGTIEKRITSAITFKGYTVRASKEEPQYLIKSETTDHLAMHKGSALKKLKSKQ